MNRISIAGTILWIVLFERSRVSLSVRGTSDCDLPSAPSASEAIVNCSKERKRELCGRRSLSDSGRAE